MPDARVRHCQRTCGRSECRVEQRRRTQARYRRDNADYWVERRLGEQAARLGESGRQPAVRVGGGGAVAARVPWELVQDAFGVQVVVLIAFLLRLVLRTAQDAIRAEVRGMAELFGQVAGGGRQDATDGATLGWHRPP